MEDEADGRCRLFYIEPLSRGAKPIIARPRELEREADEQQIESPTMGRFHYHAAGHIQCASACWYVEDGNLLPIYFNVTCASLDTFSRRAIFGLSTAFFTDSYKLENDGRWLSGRHAAGFVLINACRVTSAH